MFSSRRYFILLGAVFLCGCVQTAGNTDLALQVSALRKDVESLKARVQVNAVRIKGLEERLVRSENRVASNEKAIYKLKKSCEELDRMMSSLVAGNTTTGVGLPGFAAEQQSMKEVVSKEPGGEKEEKSAVEEAQGGAKVELTDRQLYRKAFDSMESGDLEMAKKLFEELVDKFPQSSLADNSLYWIGEIYYSHKDFQSALFYFKRVVNEYPSGNKVAAAMLKMGLCYKSLGDLEKATRTLKELVESYPSSNEASIAKVKLIEWGR